MANKRKLRVVCHLQRLMDKKTEELGLSETRYGFSQQQLSKESGVSQGTLRKMGSNAHARLDFEVVETLMNYFGCRFEDLYTIELEDSADE